MLLYYFGHQSKYTPSLETYMKRIVVGTAGHIDHGKTTLIRALTGIDCDRLKEEKERGITTELGFAHYRLGEDLLLGIVDVPGHERFVRHMVAGAWGIDMVLLVIAADEGVMPQTREHVDICELLGLKTGIIAITKTDMVDEDMVELVKEDVKDFMKGRPFENAPVIPVSATTGEGLDLLRDTIGRMAEELRERAKEGIFRLPVDRVFTLKGLGTVVTGTCISGSIKIGDEIEIYPVNRFAKVRNIQAYHEDTQEAVAGERIALNLQGIEKQDIERGTIIGRPDTLVLSSRIDTSFKYLKLPLKPIKHETMVRFHIATTLEEARLILLTKDAIEPGEELFAQFLFKEPIVALPDDRFIIRGSYVIQTVGGGTVLDIAPRKHKRKSDSLDETYALLTAGTLRDKAEFHILKGEFGGIKKSRLSVLLGMAEKQVEPTLERLNSNGTIKSIGKTVVHRDRFTEYKKMLVTILDEFHAKNPVKVGLSKEELRTRLPKVEPVIFQTALDGCAAEGALEIEKDKVRIKDTSGKKDKGIEAIESKIVKKLVDSGITPPSLKDLSLELNQNEQLMRDIVQKLVHEGTLVRVKGDLFFHSDVITVLKEKVVLHLKAHKEMSPADFKGLFDISRKYAIPILEYLDEIKLTIRSGETRVLR